MLNDMYKFIKRAMKDINKKCRKGIGLDKTYAFLKYKTKNKEYSDIIKFIL